MALDHLDHLPLQRLPDGAGAGGGRALQVDGGVDDHLAAQGVELVHGVAQVGGRHLGLAEGAVDLAEEGRVSWAASFFDRFILFYLLFYYLFDFIIYFIIYKILSFILLFIRFYLLFYFIIYFILSFILLFI